MHELSIATSMVEMATDAAAAMGDVQVLAVHLKLGRLSGVVGDALLFSWDIVCENTPLAGARLVIDDSPIVVYCAACDADRTLGTDIRLACPVCEAPTPDIVGGNELEVTAMEVV